MGTTLQNGVYLPNEGERNCYAGLKTNWEILDQKVADVTALQQAVAGALHREIVESLPTTDIDPNTIYMILSGTSATENVYNEFMYVNNAWELIGTSATDLTNYYTKGEVDGLLLLKANASDLTSHTGDTTIHVTTADKTKWNNQTYVFRYSSTALVASSTNSNTLLDNTDNLKVGDKVIDSSGVLFSITAIDTVNSTFTVGSALIDLALDANVVHTSGNETVGGQKTFSNIIPIDGVYLGNESSTNERTTLCLRSNRDTANKSCAYISRFRSNKNQGELSDSDSSFISISFLENETRYTRCFDFGLTDWDADGVPQTYYLTSPTSKGALGTSSRKWKSINGLEPSALSMPDLSNGIDISSYITLNSDSSYAPLSDGYIYICCYSSSACGLWVRDSNNNGVSTRSIGSVPTYNNLVSICIPVVKNVSISIFTPGCENILTAKFFPCQGNV